MKTPRNPFLLSGYHSAEYFCNREKELADLKAHLLNERNVVLFSWRRLGKSALIKRYLLEEEKKGKLEYVYIDLMATTNTQKAIETLIEGVFQTFGQTKSGISISFQQLIASVGASVKFNPLTGMPTFAINFTPHYNTANSLNSIGQFLSGRKKRIVIAIDEFQQISKYKNENAEAVFRSFMQSFPDIRFIFSGSHRQMMSSMFLESNRPFYKSCQLMSLTSIPIEEYTPFIKSHFSDTNKKISDELIEAIYNWSRGQTYSIQLLCNRFYGSNIPLTLEGLRNIQQSIMEQEAPLFGNYFQLLTHSQWNVLHAIAKAENVKNPLAKEFLNTHGLGAASTVSSALKTLIEKELVIKDNEHYQVHDIIFSRWLQTK